MSDSVSYLWPTNASPYLSSTFAETRSAHLHSGIDIRTWGREGYEVYATRDGVVYRIGISPNGYGKVIHLIHDDGSFSVYAHLYRFEPELMAYADSIRLQDFRFEIDVFPDDEEKFEYKRGDVIGYTGSTGVGPPHLHFELRTPDFEPFNPMLTNLGVTDNIPPVFSAIAVESLHPESLHFTGYETISPQGSRAGATDFGTIYTDSPIGLAVIVHDRTNRTPNVYAVYKIAMTANQDTLFQSTADRFGFGESQMMFLDRSYPILAERREGFQRLFVANGNRLPFYGTLKNRGILALDEGEHYITITAEDINGNKSRATVTVVFEKNSIIKNITSVPAYPYIDLSALKHDYTILTNSRKQVHPHFISDTGTAPAGPYSNGDHSRIYYDRSTPPSIGKIIQPGKRITLAGSGNRAWLQIPANSLYDTLAISMEYDTSGELPVIRFNPNRLPVKTPMQLTMMLPEPLAEDPHIGLYSFDEFRNRTTFLSSSIKNRVLKAEINEFTELRLIRDKTAPWIGRPEIVENPDENTIVKLPVVDRDSGIDYKRSNIMVNGRRGIIEYDHDKKLLIFYHPDFELKNGENRVDAVVYDRTGNRSNRQFTVFHQN